MTIISKASIDAGVMFSSKKVAIKTSEIKGDRKIS